jgi:hypothetical protein
MSLMQCCASRRAALHLPARKSMGSRFPFRLAADADDLIVPLPPEAAERRRSRAGGEPYRSNDYSGTQWAHSA